MLAECLFVAASLCSAAKEPAPAFGLVNQHKNEFAQTVFQRPVNVRLLLPMETEAATLAIEPRVRAKAKPRWYTDKKFLALSGGAYALAYADVLKTLRLRDWSQENGGTFYERNPMTQLVVKSKPAMLIGAGGMVTGANYLSWKMKNSRGRWRKVWWLPQVVAMGLNATGILTTSSIPGEATGAPGLGGKTGGPTRGGRVRIRMPQRGNAGVLNF